MVLFACTPTRTSAPQPPDNKHTEQPTALHFAAPRGSRRRNLRTRWNLAAPVVRALLEFLLRARLLLVRWRGLVGRLGLGSWIVLLDQLTMEYFVTYVKSSKLDALGSHSLMGMNPSA